jgi:hypothetical protein
MSEISTILAALLSEGNPLFEGQPEKSHGTNSYELRTPHFFQDAQQCVSAAAIR